MARGEIMKDVDLKRDTVTLRFRLCAFLSVSLCACLLATLVGCGGGDPTPAPPPPPTQPSVAKADPVSAPLIGQPATSGYVDGKARIQIGPNPALRELHSPKVGPQFLLVALNVDGPGTLVPADYKVEIQNKRYTPKAVGFGQPGGVYASVADFVAPQVELALGDQDQPQVGGLQIQRCVLATPQVVLVYDVPKSNAPVLRHGANSLPLTPNLAALEARLGDESVSSMTNASSVRLPGAEDEKVAYRLEVLDAQRVKMDITGRKTDAALVQVELHAEQPTTVELSREDLDLAATDGGRSGRGVVFLDLKEDQYLGVAGSELQYEETYNGQPLIGLISGGLRVSVSPAEPLKFRLFFLNPPKEPELVLHFPGVESIDLAGVLEPLSQFPVPEERMPDYVARGPIIGTPVLAGYLSGPVQLASNPSKPENTSAESAADGRKFLVIRFRMNGNEQTFVLNDYVLFAPGLARYLPRAVAFGEAPYRYVSGLGFRELTLATGAATAPEVRKGQVESWTLAQPEVTLLYEVPEEPQFVFVHGSTQFVVENPPTLDAGLVGSK